MKTVPGGLFIVFEGSDGSGKTTLSRMVVEELRAEGYSVVYTREPGGTTIGKTLRSLVANSDSDITPRAELLCYAADRAHHLDSLVKPALERGDIVVSDRYYQSSMAYQGAGRGHDENMLLCMQEAAGTFEPDFTFIIDAPLAVGRSRAMAAEEKCDVKATEQRFERLDNDFHARVREAYIMATPHFDVGPRNSKYIHVDNSIDGQAPAVAHKIVGIISERLKPKASTLKQVLWAEGIEGSSLYLVWLQFAPDGEYHQYLLYTGVLTLDGDIMSGQYGALLWRPGSVPQSYFDVSFTDLRVERCVPTFNNGIVASSTFNKTNT